MNRLERKYRKAKRNYDIVDIIGYIIGIPIAFTICYYFFVMFVELIKIIFK